MKILILGASGLTGRELVKQALAQNHTVTAFVRTPEKFKMTDENLKVVQGDVSDKAAVERAVQEQEAVLSALGSPNPFGRFPEIVEGMRNVVAEMEKEGVRRFVYQSALGVGESGEDAGFFVKNIILPLFLGGTTADHEEKEKIIKSSNLDWIIVRPGVLTGGERTDKHKTGVHIKPGYYASVSRADVADFMLKQLTDDRFLRQTPSIFY